MENYAGFPAGNLQGFLDDALPPERGQALPPRQPNPKHKEAVTGPELMELMRQQALNFGSEIRTQDVVRVDLKSSLRVIAARNLDDDSEEDIVHARAIIIATGARANYLGLPSEEAFKNRGRQRLRRLRWGTAALSQQAAGRGRRRRLGSRGSRPT